MNNVFFSFVFSSYPNSLITYRYEHEIIRHSLFDLFVIWLF